MAVSFSASDYELAGVILPRGLDALPERAPIFAKDCGSAVQAAARATGAADEAAELGARCTTRRLGPVQRRTSRSPSGLDTAGGSSRDQRHRAALKKQPSSRGSDADARSSRQSGAQEYMDRSLTKYIQLELLGGMLKSGVFRGLVLGLITANSVLVGLQTSVEIDRAYAGLFLVLDFMFLTFFAVEIVLKWLADFWGFWRVGWNVFDFLIVFISLAGQGLSFMSSGRVLRTLRVLRAFRTIKSIRMVRGLQMIVSTVFRSLPDMGNIFLLLGIVMFIFAVAGVNIFGHDLPARFGSLHRAMYTLFIALTQDGWAKVFKELSDVGLYGIGSVFFFFFIMIGAFVFMNIISGVIVTNFQRAHEEFNRARQLKFRILNVKDSDAPEKETVLKTRLPTQDELAGKRAGRDTASDGGAGVRQDEGTPRAFVSPTSHTAQARADRGLLGAAARCSRWSVTSLCCARSRRTSRNTTRSSRSSLRKSTA